MLTLYGCALEQIKAAMPELYERAVTKFSTEREQLGAVVAVTNFAYHPRSEGSKACVTTPGAFTNPPKGANIRQCAHVVDMMNDDELDLLVMHVKTVAKANAATSSTGSFEVDLDVLPDPIAEFEKKQVEEKKKAEERAARERAAKIAEQRRLEEIARQKEEERLANLPEKVYSDDQWGDW